MPAAADAGDIVKAAAAHRVDHRRRSMKAQMRTANNDDYRNAVIIGEDEVRQGTATLRDMQSGGQETIPQSKLVSRLSAEAEQQ